MNHLVQTNVGLATAPDKDLLIGLVPFFGWVFPSVYTHSPLTLALALHWGPLHLSEEYVVPIGLTLMLSSM
jgi:hypothetical protein